MRKHASVVSVGEHQLHQLEWKAGNIGNPEDVESEFSSSRGSGRQKREYRAIESLGPLRSRAGSAPGQDAARGRGRPEGGGAGHQRSAPHLARRLEPTRRAPAAVSSIR